MVEQNLSEHLTYGNDLLLEHLGIRRELLPIVSLEERLVPADYVYGREQLVPEILEAMRKRKDFAGYPGQGLHWSEREYAQWEKSRRPVEALVGIPGNRPSYFVGLHENRNIVEDGHLTSKLKNPNIELYRADGSQVAHRERFKGLALASDGSPIHPYFKEAVTSPEGIVTGSGFYWNLGKNFAADPVFVRITDGKVQVLLVDRGDKGGIALPGGMLDRKRKGWVKGGAVAGLERAIDAAKRETGEETGVNIENASDILGIPILEEVYVGDFRMTAQAFPVTSVYMFVPRPQTAEILAPKAGDDAALAQWLGAGGQVLWRGTEASMWEGVTRGDMFASHASYIKLAVLQFEKMFGVVVREDGVVGRSE